MREILFRGKRVDNGEWVEGELLHDMKGRPWIYWTTPKELPIFFSRSAIVKSETIGQYIGLKDKNGKKIFEGDIVQYQPEYWCEPLQSVVEYCADKWNYPAFDLNDHNYAANGLQCVHEEGGCEVIGNIHDNPELLEVKQ